MTLDEQLDNYAITSDVAKMAREANDELRRYEKALAKAHRICGEAARLLAHIGYVGEVDSRHPRVEALGAALDDYTEWDQPDTEL